MYISPNQSPSLAFIDAATVLREDNVPARNEPKNETQTSPESFAFRFCERIFGNAATIFHEDKVQTQENLQDFVDEGRRTVFLASLAITTAAFFFGSLVYIPVTIFCINLLFDLFLELGMEKEQNKPKEIKEQAPPPYQLNPLAYQCA